MTEDTGLEIAEDSYEEEILLETLLQIINNQYEHVAEIHVAHLPTLPDVSELLITVHTWDADSLEEHVDVSSATHVIINPSDETPLRFPYDVVATFDGPRNIQRDKSTTVYKAEGVRGGDGRDLATGLTQLRRKLSGTCPTCGAKTKILRQHYNESRTCANADF